MNSLYKIISKQRWIIPFYILVLIFAIFYATKLIFDFRDDRMITFLIQPIFFLIVFMIAVYFFKDNNKLLLLFTSFTMWFFVEFALYKVSPYKSYVEANGGYYYISISAHNQLEHSRKPNQEIFHKQNEFTMSFRTNSLGFRGEEVDSSLTKVIIIGDSYIEGWGVDNDSTLNKVFNRKLNCNNCVMNAGVAGSDIISAYTRLENLLKNLHPNLVILNINGTDYSDIFLRYLNNENTKKSIYFEFFYGTSFVFRHFAHLFLNVDFILLFSNTNELAYKEKINALIFEYLNKYEKLLQNQNIKFFVLSQPLLEDLKYIANKANLSDINKFLEENQFMFYNPHIDFQNQESYESLYWPSDGHFNNKGTRIYGDLVFEALKKEFNIDSLLKN